MDNKMQKSKYKGQNDNVKCKIIFKFLFVTLIFDVLFLNLKT